MTSPPDLDERVYDIHDYYRTSFEFYEFEDYEIKSEYEIYRELKTKLKRPFDDPDGVGIMLKFMKRNIRSGLI